MLRPQAVMLRPQAALLPHGMRSEQWASVEQNIAEKAPKQMRRLSPAPL